jgi:hypothetical protein
MDFLKVSKLRMTTTYMNEYYQHKRAQCSRFHQNVLPEDGPVRLKHVASHRVYFNNILRTFNWHFSELDVMFGVIWKKKCCIIDGREKQVIPCKYVLFIAYVDYTTQHWTLDYYSLLHEKIVKLKDTRHLNFYSYHSLTQALQKSLLLYPHTVLLQSWNTV